MNLASAAFTSASFSRSVAAPTAHRLFWREASTLLGVVVALALAVVL